MPQMKLKGQGRHEEEGQGRQQRKPVGGLKGLHVEDPHQGGQDEGPGHQAGDVRIEHDEDAPLEFHLVRIHESAYGVQKAFVHGASSRIWASESMGSSVVMAGLADGSVEAVVVGLRAGGEVRLEHLDLVGSQVDMDRIVGILEVPEPAASGRAHLGTGGGEALGDAVVAEIALVHGVGAGIDEAAPVGAGLDAVAAAHAVGLVHQHRPIRRDEGRAHRTDLGAGRIRALVAHLRHEEVLGAVLGAVLLGKPVVAAVRRVHVRRLAPRHDVVALHPGAKIEGLQGYVVLLLAGAHAAAAADALLDVDHHAPPVIHRFVVGGGLGLPSHDVLEGGGGSGREEEVLSSADEEISTRQVHFEASLT